MCDRSKRTITKNLEAQTKDRDHSLEEQAGLPQAVAPPERLGTLIAELFGREHGVELELPPREPHEPIDFSEDGDPAPGNADPDASRGRE